MNARRVIRANRTAEPAGTADTGRISNRQRHRDINRDDLRGDDRPRRVGEAPGFEWRDMQEEHRLAEGRAEQRREPFAADLDPQTAPDVTEVHTIGAVHTAETHRATERPGQVHRSVEVEPTTVHEPTRVHEQAHALDADVEDDHPSGQRTFAITDPVDAAHRRFGGLDIGASLAGMLAGLGMTALFGGIFAAIGNYGYQLDVERNAEVLTVGGVATGLMVLFLSFLVGGWVAGRIARYDGGRNGLWAATWFLVLGLLLSAAGATWGDEYNVLDRLEVPRWFSDNWSAETFVNAAVGSALLAIALLLLAGFLGGVAGTRYHRTVDRVIADTDRELALEAQRDRQARQDEQRWQEQRDGIVTAATTATPVVARSGLDRTDADRDVVDLRSTGRTDSFDPDALPHRTRS